jgi:putative membrane protein
MGDSFTPTFSSKQLPSLPLLPLPTPAKPPPAHFPASHPMVYLDNPAVPPSSTSASSSRSPSPPHPSGTPDPARSNTRRNGTLKIERYLGQQAITISRSMSPTLPEHNDVRMPTFPLSHASRQKPRKWPLAFRFIKGAIHHVIIVPIILHAVFTTLVVYFDRVKGYRLGLPASIVPTLSIVVGLMLVFRNSTSYERYWGGRQGLQSIVTTVRNLSRSFLVCGPLENDRDRQETEMTVKCLVALMYAIKNYLRGNWGIAGYDSTYAELLPRGMKGHESEGLGLPLELCFVIERYIKRGVQRGAFNAPQSSMLSAQLNSLMDSFGKMETIKLTPIPVCHQIHQKQVLALYCCVLPFCLIGDLGWWSIPVVALVCFTLYGIEGIGEELEDPFGEDKNDIRMDEIIEDVRNEVEVMLEGFRKGDELYYQPTDE